MGRPGSCYPGGCLTIGPYCGQSGSRPPTNSRRASTFLAGDSNGSEFARTLTVYRYDRSAEQSQPLTTVDDASLETDGSYVTMKFSTASCGPISLNTTGVTNGDTRAHRTNCCLRPIRPSCERARGDEAALRQ